MAETRDALGNRVTVDANDYRVLQPRLVSDPNRNRTEVAFDTLGMVVGTAVMGKPQEGIGDNLDGFVADLTQTKIEEFFANPQEPDTNDPLKRSRATAIVHQLLGNATTRIIYDLDRFRRTRKDHSADPDKWEPSFAATIARETHLSDLQQGQESKLQISFSYSDGFGREIQKKIQAEPGPLVEGGPVVSPRWVGSGWTIFNNKGKPVRQYEPFFSATHGFEFGVMVGVSPVLFYDPAERVIATLHPNHTYEKVVFDPWQQTTYDVNDTCAPRNATDRRPAYRPRHPGLRGRVLQDAARNLADLARAAHRRRTGSSTSNDGRPTGRRARRHAHHRAFRCPGPPLPDRGAQPRRLRRSRPRRHRGQLRHPRRAGHRRQPARSTRRTQIARQSPADGCARAAHRHALRLRHARQPHPSAQHGSGRALDAERRGRQAHPRLGQPRPQLHHQLRRAAPPRGADRARHQPRSSDPRTLNRDILVDKIEYGEGIANAEALNLRTRIYRHFDSAGVATNARLDANGNPIEAYDFKGNLLHSTRRLVSDYDAIPDWLLNPQLDAETFEGSTRYDALNRPIQSIAPHSSLARVEHPNKINVIQPVFNEANLLEQVDVWLERAAEPAALLDPND